MSVKIKFDANQNYQIKAVDSVVNLFEGISKEELGNDIYEGIYEENFELNSNSYTDSIGNVDELFEFSSDFIKDNLDRIQQENHIKIKPEMDPTNNGDTLTSSALSSDFWEYPEFTVNMETGTGKTYVYLRTIYSLFEKYGFRKFIIVVPSVAIYEGVVSTFNATREHFQTLFSPNAIPIEIKEYDTDVTIFKDFATSTSLQILLMTIDSFNKSSNVVYKATEKIRGGKLPVNYIQECRPILMLDEVQNYQTIIARRALRTLHPLFSVGYSATPGENPINEVYRLTSYEASQMNLVKKISVFGFQEEQIATENEDYFKILSINNTSSAELVLQFLKNGAVSTQIVTIKKDESFQKKTKNPAYGDLCIINISLKENNQYVELNNGLRYSIDQASCARLSKEVVFRNMIRATIREHIDKQSRLRDEGVKVLSLFFIDRVASYKGDNPRIANIFDEEFELLKESVPEWKNLSGKDVREGYFALKPKSKSTEFEEIDTSLDNNKKSKDEKAAEKRAYKLIMQGKEKLLSKEEPVCFIFAHSALREGWDNPNVFQICALREITSESNRRQTIGRGLRLPVNQEGIRLNNRELNQLTVIANESYNRFVSKLQEEYIAEGIMPKSFITDKRKMEPVKRTVRYGSKEFESIWTKVNTKTEYKININTEKLIKEAIEKLNRTTFEEPKLVCTKGNYVITMYDLKLEAVTPTNEALFKITVRDSDHEDLFGEVGTTRYLTKNDSFDKKFKDCLSECPELGKLKVVDINYNEKTPEQSSIILSGIEEPMFVGQIQTHTSTSGHSLGTSTVTIDEDRNIPKCNIVERTSREVNITRRTILKIFKGMKRELIQNYFMKNPEGFTSQFIEVLKDVVANHIACNIEYSETENSINSNRDELFPVEKIYTSTELVDANIDRSIYEKVQVDSEVESHFVDKLNTCDKQNGGVTLYFKFPPKYKINLPKIIGNYNPDWAVVRRDNQNVQVEIVRETKGTEELENLPHTNEARKIICAQKHFKAVGVDYKFIDDKDDKWFERCNEDYNEKLFGEKKDVLYKDTDEEQFLREVADSGKKGLTKNNCGQL